MLDKNSIGPKRETVGLWCRKDKKWYYLESAGHATTSNLDRIKRVLITRELVVFDKDGIKYGHEPYKVMTYAEAQEKGCEIEPIYLNAHVKSSVLKAEKEKVTASSWNI